MLKLTLDTMAATLEKTLWHSLYIYSDARARARIEPMSDGLLTWTDALPNTILAVARVLPEGISGLSYTQSVTFRARRQ